MLKRIVLGLIIFAIGISPLWAQSEDSDQTSKTERERQYLVSENVDITGVFSFDIVGINAGGSVEAGLGYRGAALFNDRFLLGGYGFDLESPATIGNVDFDYEEGGLWLGTYFYPQSAVHTGIHLQLGWSDLKSKQKFNGEKLLTTYLVVNPMLTVEANLSEHLSVGASAGWRQAFETGSGFSADEQKLSGLQGMLSISYHFGHDLNKWRKKNIDEWDDDWDDDDEWEDDHDWDDDDWD